jgi:hypothetical protein
LGISPVLRFKRREAGLPGADTANPCLKIDIDMLF